MDERAADQPSAGEGEPARRSLWVTAAVNVLIALVVVGLVQHFVVRVHNVRSGSMEQTLAVTDRILSSNLPYLTNDPARGDIVIFGHGDTWEDERRPAATDPLRALVRLFGDLTGIGTSSRYYTVKRVIGVGGDTVACCDAEGRLTVNGEPLEEPYLYDNLPFAPGTLDCASTPRSARCFGPITVPDGDYLVMGDHRGNSSDSVYGCRSAMAPVETCARFVPQDRISGKVVGKLWPPGPVG